MTNREKPPEGGQEDLMVFAFPGVNAWAREKFGSPPDYWPQMR